MAKKKKPFELIDGDLRLALPRQLPFKFLNKEQEKVSELFNNSCILILTGPAGTGKTFLASLLAINELLLGRQDKILLTRPAISAGEDYGHLPGELNSKYEVWVQCLLEAIDKITGRDAYLKKCILDKIEFAPMCHLRGKNMIRTVSLLDECQNCTYTQLKLYLSRISLPIFSENNTSLEYAINNGSKMILTGDLTQTDLPPNKSGLHEVIKRLQDLPGVSIMDFSEDCIVRHPLIVEMLKRLK